MNRMEFWAKSFDIKNSFDDFESVWRLDIGNVFLQSQNPPPRNYQTDGGEGSIPWWFIVRHRGIARKFLISLPRASVSTQAESLDFLMGNIVLRKGIKWIPVWFPCAEQSFSGSSAGAVVRSLQNAPLGRSNEFVVLKTLCRFVWRLTNNSFHIFNSFDDLHSFDGSQNSFDGFASNVNLLT